MAAPDDAVGRGDHIEGKAGERLQGRFHILTVGHDDVGVVLLGLDEHLGQAHLVVEALRGGVMLAEGVVGEQDAI